MNQRSAEIFKFLVSGAFLVGADVGLYSILIHFLPFAVSKAISFTFGGILAYLINKFWVFKQAKRSPAEVVRFILGNSTALVLNVTTNALMLRVIEGAVLPAVVVATGVTAVFTYVVFKFWVFSGK